MFNLLFRKIKLCDKLSKDHDLDLMLFINFPQEYIYLIPNLDIYI